MVCALAAEGGHLAVLKWAREQDPPCQWDGRTFDTAHHSPKSNAETLQYVLANECPTEYIIDFDFENETFNWGHGWLMTENE
jgi:hypothetical protein